MHRNKLEEGREGGREGEDREWADKGRGDLHYTLFFIYNLFHHLVQGTMMGFLTAAGSLARAMGPLLITILYQHKGPAITFATVVGVIGVSIIVLLLFCRRLVPYRPSPDYRTIN